MSEINKVLDQLILRDPEILFSETNIAIAKSASQTVDILTLVTQLIKLIPVKIEEAKNNGKFFCDISIPNEIKNGEICDWDAHHISPFDTGNWTTITRYGDLKQIFIRKEGFLLGLIEKIKSDNYKCELIVKGTYQYMLRIAWCKNNLHLKSFGIT